MRWVARPSVDGDGPRSARPARAAMRTRRSPARLAALAGIAFASIGVSSTAFAQTTANWVAPVSDVWTADARWSNGTFPDNNGPNTFNANISVNGAAYTVTLDRNITLTGLNVDSIDGRLDLTSFTMTTQNLTIADSLVRASNAAGTIDISTTATLRGGTVQQVRNFISRGTLRIEDGGVDNDICDSDIRHRGNQGFWTGTRDLVIMDGSSFTIESGGRFEFQNAARIRREVAGGQVPVLRNEGTLVKSSAGVSFVEGARFQNTGSLTVSAGTLRSDTFDVPGNTLGAATYVISGGASLQLDGVTINTNSANVTLRDAGSTFAALANATTNSTTGRLSFQNGANFTTGGNFKNDGNLAVGAATIFAVPAGSTFLNVLPGFIGSTLVDGIFEVEGEIRADNLAGLANINTTITFNGTAATLADSAGNDQLPGVRTLGALADVTLTGGRDITTTGDFTVDNGGSFTVDDNSDFRVAPGFALTNFNNGDFTSGTFNVRGIVQADNLTVDTVRATSITLDNTGRFLDGDGNDSFASLADVQSNGRFTLANGRSLSLLQSLTLTGTAATVTVGNGAALCTLTIPQDLTVNAGTTLALDNGQINVAGTLTLNGSLRGNGLINGNIVADGVLSPGRSPGTLNITGDLALTTRGTLLFELGGTAPGLFDRVFLDGILTHDDDDDIAGKLSLEVLAGYIPQDGDTFILITFLERSGQFQFFENLRFGGGEFVVIEAPNSISVRYVAIPAPGAMVALGFAALIAARRRR